MTVSLKDPHMAGTPGDWKTVEYTKKTLEEAGFTDVKVRNAD